MVDTRDVIIEYPVTGNGHIAGERYAVKDAATAALVHPNAVIIGYAGQSDLRVNQVAADYLNNKLEAIEALGWVDRTRLAPDVAAAVAAVPRDHTNRLTALRPFWTGLAKRATAPVDLLHFGTSITEGAYASTFAYRWVERLRDVLRARYPVAGVAGGVGYIPAEYKVNQLAGTPWTYTGGTSGTFGSGLYGLGRRYRVMSALGNKIAISATCSSFDVLYARNTPNGTLGITVDGVEVASIASGGSATGGLKLSSGPLTPGVHAIQLTWNAGGPVWVEGVMIYNGDETKGIRMWEGGFGGAKSQYFVAPEAPYWQNDISTIQPDLVTIELGTNDWMYNTGVVSGNYGSFPPSYTKSNIEKLIADVRTKTTVDPAIALLAVHNRGDYPASPTTLLNPWSDYVNVMYEIAANDPGVAVIDMPSRMGATPWVESGLLNADMVHPNDAGTEFYAQAIAGFLAP